MRQTCWFGPEVSGLNLTKSFKIVKEDLQSHNLPLTSHNQENNMKWKTKDGTVLEIKNMETSHIINTMHMLERNETQIGYNLMKKFEHFASTLTQDSVAEFHAQGIIDSWYSDEDGYYSDFKIDSYPPYKAMLQELSNRGISY